MCGVRLPAVIAGRLSSRTMVVLLVAAMVALLALTGVSSALIGRMTQGSQLWPALSVLTITLVIATVGLVVAGRWGSCSTSSSAVC